MLLKKKYMFCYVVAAASYDACLLCCHLRPCHIIFAAAAPCCYRLQRRMALVASSFCLFLLSAHFRRDYATLRPMRCFMVASALSPPYRAHDS